MKIDHVGAGDRREERQEGGLFDALVDPGLDVTHRLVEREEPLVVADVLTGHWDHHDRPALGHSGHDLSQRPPATADRYQFQADV